VVLQKELHNKCVVAEIDELLLGVDVGEQGCDEGEDLVSQTNMGQTNNGEGGEEVLVMDVERLDAKLQRVFEEDDYEVKLNEE
jgi:hypothetical protein